MHVSGLPSDPGAAVSRLFEEHGDRLYRLGLRLCDRPDRAEDLVQETLLHAYRAWSGFEGRSEPLTWLFSIAARLCRRMERRRVGQPRYVEPLSTMIQRQVVPVSPFVSEAEDPLDRVIRREEVARLQAAITKLPSAFRLPLVLKDLEGFSIREVGEILGLREATVKTRLHRARLALRESLPLVSPVGIDEAEHARRRCTDLVKAKLEAMDRGVPFPIDSTELCSRCRPLLEGLDRHRFLCSAVSGPSVPPALEQRLAEVLSSVDASHDTATGRSGSAGSR